MHVCNEEYRAIFFEVFHSWNFESRVYFCLLLFFNIVRKYSIKDFVDRRFHCISSFNILKRRIFRFHDLKDEIIFGCFYLFRNIILT